MTSQEKYTNPFTDFGFKKLFGSELNKDLLITPDEKVRYEESLKYYRDLKNVIDTSFDEGKEVGKAEGREESKIEMILEMANEGFNIAQIAKVTKKTEEEIKQILENHKSK